MNSIGPSLEHCGTPDDARYGDEMNMLYVTNCIWSDEWDLKNMVMMYEKSWYLTKKDDWVLEILTLLSKSCIFNTSHSPEHLLSFVAIIYVANWTNKFIPWKCLSDIISWRSLVCLPSWIFQILVFFNEYLKDKKY